MRSKQEQKVFPGTDRTSGRRLLGKFLCIRKETQGLIHGHNVLIRVIDGETVIIDWITL